MRGFVSSVTSQGLNEWLMIPPSIFIDHQEAAMRLPCKGWWKFNTPIKKLVPSFLWQKARSVPLSCTEACTNSQQHIEFPNTKLVLLAHLEAHVTFGKLNELLAKLEGYNLNEHRLNPGFLTWNCMYYTKLLLPCVSWSTQAT